VAVYGLEWLWIGPLFSPDSAGYQAYADAILNDFTWLHDAGVDQSAIPLLVFRTAGYPLLIAAARLVAGLHWASVLVAFQLIIAVPALLALYDLASRIFAEAGRWWPAAVTALYGLSLPAAYHLSILTDSIYSSLFVLVTCRLAAAALDRRRPPPRQLALWGVLLGLSIWIRPTGMFFAPLVLPLVVVAIWHGPWRSRAFAAASFVIPLTLLPVLYAGWNHHRTGHAVISTVGQTDYFFPILVIMGRHAPVELPDDGRVANAIRDVQPSFDYAGTVQLNERLHVADGLDCFAIERAAFEANAYVLRHHPGIFALYLLRNLARNHARIIFDPTYVAERYHVMRTGGASILHTRAMLSRLIDHPAMTDVAIVPVLVFFSLLSGTATLLWATLPLLLWFRRRITDRAPAMALFYLWLLFWLVAIFYAAVRVEDRELMPVLPGLILGVVWGTNVLGAWWRQRGARNGSRCAESPQLAPSQGKEMAA